MLAGLLGCQGAERRDLIQVEAAVPEAPKASVAAGVGGEKKLGSATWLSPVGGQAQTVGFDQLGKEFPRDEHSEEQ
ncbi:hypothetical protein ACWGNN_45295 [Streptomyces sp. NPDC055817]